MALCSAFFPVLTLFGGFVFPLSDIASGTVAGVAPVETDIPAVAPATVPVTADTVSLPLVKPGKVSLEISHFNHAWLAPDADLVFTVDIANGTDRQITVSEIDVNAQNTVANTQYSLYYWMNGSIISHPLFSFPGTQNIPAGEVKSVEVTVPRSEISWAGTRFAWGPRGVEACAVIDQGNDGKEKVKRADLCDRSVTVVAPTQEINPMPLAVSLPLTLNSEELSRLPGIFDSLTDDSADAESDKKALTRFTSADRQEKFSNPGANDSEINNYNSEKSTNTSADALAGNKHTDAEPGTDLNSDSGKKEDTSEPHPKSADFPQEIRQSISNTIKRFENLEATFFIDPALLEDSQLRQELQDSGVTQNLLLPYADADLQGLIAGKMPEQINTAYALGAELKNDEDLREVFSAEKIAVLENIPQHSELIELADLGITTAIISGAQRSVAHEFFYTQEATRKIAVSEDNISNKSYDFTLLLSNDPITRALEGKLITYRDVNGIEISLNDRSQIVLALSAIYFNEAPNLTRPLLVQVPRTLANAHADSAQQQSLYNSLSALTSAPWLQNTSVTDLIDTRAPLQSLPNFSQSEQDKQDKAETVAFFQSPEISNLPAVADSFIEKTKIFQQDEAFGDFAQQRLISAFSNSWRANRQAHQRYLQEVFSIAALKDNLKFEPSSTINMISESSALPARVHNLFNQDVRVQITLVSSDNRLSSSEIVHAILPAKQVSNIALPVKANGWGNIRVLLKVLDLNGNDLGIQMNLNMRIRSNLENTVTIILGSLFALILVYGICRSVSNGRRAVPMSQAEIESASLFEKSD